MFENVMLGLLIVFIFALIYSNAKSSIDQFRIKKQSKYLADYPFPKGVHSKLSQSYPQLSDGDMALVEKAMRQYFRLHAQSKATLAMPSRIVDEYWHEFILHTAVYEEFCQKALGRFIHHTPANGQQGNANLQRTWARACRDEGLNPAQTTLPLLFAIDAVLAIPDGKHYSGAQLAAASQSSSSCSSGCSSSDHSDSNDSSSGCSSGCGGGGGGD